MANAKIWGSTVVPVGGGVVPGGKGMGRRQGSGRWTVGVGVWGFIGVGWCCWGFVTHNSNIYNIVGQRQRLLAQ